MGVLPGILLGTACSIGILLGEMAKPQDALLGRVSCSDQLHDVGEDEKAEGIPGLVVCRFYGPLFFANVGFFIEWLQGFIDTQMHPVRQVVIDARAMRWIDYTAGEKLLPFFQRLSARGIEIVMARAHLPLRELRMSKELRAMIPQEKICVRVSDAVAAFEARPVPTGDAGENA